jgi:protein-disulfide isomerase
MRGRWRAAAAMLALAAGCERPGTETTATTTTARAAVASTTMPLRTTTDAQDLERRPASTPPLADAVAPPTPPLPGLPGTPNSSPAAGPLDAPVRVYVFTDYQCPVCRRALEPLKLLARSFPTDVCLIVKHAASSRHPLAADAAAASLAAFRQQRFWALQDRLFVDQTRLARPALLAAARDLGLDASAFERDLDDEAVVAQIRYESALAEQLGVAATPSFVVNGRVQRGWGSYRGLESVVEREIVRASVIAGEGVPRARVAYEATRRVGPDGERLAAALFEPLP